MVRGRQARARDRSASAGAIPVEAWTGFTDSPVYADAEQIANRLIEEYVEERVDRVLLIYNHFDSPLVQNVVVEQLLPVPIDELEEISAHDLAQQGLLLFEPEEKDILPDLLARRWRPRCSARCWSRQPPSTALA